MITLKGVGEKALFVMSLLYNALIIPFSLKSAQIDWSSDFKELNEIQKRSGTRTDISDYLTTIFLESLNRKPTLIVELGVRGGESTFVFERLAKLISSKFVSVDITDCSTLSSYKDWLFVQKDDLEFANKFKSYCVQHGFEPNIDVLFIDTSHLFEHTVKEIESWFPFLSKGAKVFFHDTNMKYVYFRKDGSMGIAWNNKRGVIKALEKYFDASFNEKKDFVGFKKGWLIKHYSYSTGLTILEKLEK